MGHQEQWEKDMEMVKDGENPWLTIWATLQFK